MIKESGVYQIVNVLTGDFYVGSAKDLYNREHTHRTALRKGRHGNKNLQKAYEEYGLDYLYFYVLEKVSVSELLNREQHYMDSLLPTYNIAPKAGSCLGIKFSEERKASISKRMTGSGNHWYGVKGSDNPLYGRKQTDNLKKQLSEMRVGEKNPMFGVTPPHAKLTDDQVREIRVKIAQGFGSKELSEEYNVSYGNIQHIKKGRSYRRVV